MKNVFSFFLLFVASSAAFGQIEWVGKYDFTESSSNIFRTSQNQYILTHDSVSGITVFDSIGDIVFLLNTTVDPPSSEIHSITSDFIELSDSSILFSYSLRGCDKDFSKLFIYNKYWELSGITEGGHFAGPAARFSNDEIVIGHVEIGMVAKFNTTGMVWAKDITQYIGINDLLVTLGDTILVATDAGLIKMDSQGEVVDSLPDLIFDKLELLPNGNILVKTTNELKIYNPQLNQLTSLLFQAGNVKDMAIGTSEIGVLTDEQKVKRLDFELVDLNQDVQLSDEFFNGLAYTNDGLMLTGNEGRGSFIKAYALDGSTANTDEDIAILAVSHGLSSSFTLDFPAFITIKDIRAIVKNEGSTAIDRLTLNMPKPNYPKPSCVAEQSVFKEYENLNLQPGESVELVWGDEGVILGWGQQTDSFELCLFVSQPDHHLDTDNSNDVSCTSVLVADHEPRPIEFQATFLPGTDELYLNLPPGIDPEKTTIAVFNTAAQLVASQKLLGDEPISLRQLPDGMYLLRASSEGKAGWVKVVKY